MTEEGLRKIPDRLVFVDVETTGLDSKKDRIIEIFMLSLSKNGEVKEYETLINPGRPLPDIITEITGLTDSDLAGAPAEGEVAAEIREFVGLGTPVAHNLPFDLRFLNALFKRNNLLELGTGGVDTLAISRALFPKLCVYPEGGGSHRLSNLMYHFGLQASYANAHRARDDVMLLVEVFRSLQAYASGNSGLSYPEAATHGCPNCGSAMQVTYSEGQTVLTCKKQPACAVKLVV
ncbi:MAG: 3'-5' exonuclease [Firmicutes bacterium]|nr:3'-5' exonuclease [Bacillota bacterium]